MNFCYFLFIFGFIINANGFSKRLNIPYKKDMLSFKKFINTYEKEYNQESQFKKGYSNYRRNIDFINNHNENSNNSFSLRINHFTDEDPQKLKENLFSFKIDKNNTTDLKNSNNNFFFSPNLNPYKQIPSKIDYRDYNVVTPVKNQGRCGSCWAFSAIGALESKYALNTGKLEVFSEQKLVDCSSSNFGCNGGFMHKAFDDLLYNDGGLSLESDYPYVGTVNNCKKDIKNFKDFNFLGYQYVLSHSSKALKEGLFHNPVCIALAGDPLKFLYYGEGIFDCNDCSKINNHAVLLVGYDTTGDVPYWIIKNSWGEKWGEDGYIRIKMQDGDGILGMNQYGLYPY